jgi:hypothetical protein
MTERIDLDDIDTGEQGDEDDSNEGDWFWRDDADSDDAPVSTQSAEDAPVGPSSADTAEDGGSTGADTAEDAPTESSAESDVPSPSIRDSTTVSARDGASDSDASWEARVPHVPRENQNSPVGIPKETGGAGAGNEGESDAGAAEPPESAESGPHGGGVDDMATALTYEAAKRLSNPAAAVADAKVWSDWIGIVGDVPAHVIGTFQRNHGVDADFFNGSGTGPGERLAEVDEHSMFYSERMVVVGVEGEDEWIAERADWEFVPVADAAAKANWELDD